MSDVCGLLMTSYRPIYNMKQNQTSMDIQRVAENKKLMKQLDEDETVLMSAKVIKINHVNKRQQRVLAVTSKHLLNIASPSSLLPNRIKRKIPLSRLTAITASRFGNEIVLHVQEEDDYRFATHNLRNKFIQAIVEAVGLALHRPLKIYYYDDLALDQYTTTILDLQKKARKMHRIDPQLVDSDSLKKQEEKPESRLVFRASTSGKVEAFEEFQIVKVLGRGAFGKVMLCRHGATGAYYAVKSMRKESLIEKESLQRTKTERFLLEKVQHPFLINLEYAFQTKEKVFLVMKFFRGGQMFSLLRKQKRFPEGRARFYAAQVFLALQYLHKMGYVYRDLKPENILFDTNGYLKVSDYGLSKRLQAGEKTYSITGTASYLSPEVLLREGHGYSVDWWALGVLIYEMIFSCPPFYLKDQREMFQNIINKELQFPKTIPVSPECRNLLRGLLHKYPEKRLGQRSADDIRNHPWFSGMEWEKLMRMQIVPDYMPELTSEQDVSNFHETFTKQEPINTIITADDSLLQQFQQEFANFDFHRSMTMEQASKRHSVNPQTLNDPPHPQPDFDFFALFKKKK